MTPVLDTNAQLILLPALFRIGGMFLAGPLFGPARVPLVLKAGAALMMTVAMGPTLLQQGAPDVTSLTGLVFLVLRELLVGILIGAVAQLVLAGIQYGGQIVGISVGLAIVNVLDPIYDAQVSIVSRLYGLCALAIFFALDAHHVLIRAVAASFQAVPVGSAVLGPPSFGVLIDLGYQVFVTGVRIAAPVMAVLLLAELAMGLMVRTVPQMNVFIVGFPLKIGLGFLLMVFTLPFLARLVSQLVHAMGESFGYLLGGM